MYASDMMTKNPIAVGPETPVSDVIDLMQEKDIRHIPVVEQGEVVGVVSDRDLRHISWTAVVGGEQRRLKVAISQFMSGDPYTVDVEADAKEAIDVMIENKVSAVPVVDPVEGKLVGIISIVDALKFARDHL